MYKKLIDAKENNFSETEIKRAFSAIAGTMKKIVVEEIVPDVHDDPHYRSNYGGYRVEQAPNARYDSYYRPGYGDPRTYQIPDNRYDSYYRPGYGSNVKSIPLRKIAVRRIEYNPEVVRNILLAIPDVKMRQIVFDRVQQKSWRIYKNLVKTYPNIAEELTGK